MSKPQDHWRYYLAPRYWPAWLGMLGLRLLALLPFKAGLALGSGLGWLLYHLIAKRRRVTEVNVRLCFKELDAAQKQQLVMDIFKANATGVIETAWAYWGSQRMIAKRTESIGFALLDKALQQGKGVILLGAHFSNLDLGGLQLLINKVDFDAVYRPHNNPLLDYWIRRKRARFSKPVDRAKFREMLRDLRKNRSIWYAPDQDFGEHGAVFVPFFGHPAATIVGTTKMVRLNKSPILFYRHQRKADNSGYSIEISEVPGFPSGDETRDAEIVNQTIEQAIRLAPAQYMWVHKRFKTQPDGRQKLYKAARC